MQEHWRKTHGAEGRSGEFRLSNVGLVWGTEGTSNLRCQIDSYLFEFEAQRNFPDENRNMSVA